MGCSTRKGAIANNSINLTCHTFTMWVFPCTVVKEDFQELTKSVLHFPQMIYPSLHILLSCSALPRSLHLENENLATSVLFPAIYQPLAPPNDWQALQPVPCFLILRYVLYHGNSCIPLRKLTDIVYVSKYHGPVNLTQF